MVTIAIVNQSSVLSDDQIAPVIAAVQRQVHEHFAPAWGLDATLVQIRKGQSAPKNKSQVVILNTSDFGAVAGYHDLTAEGFPLGKVFVKADMETGRSWSITLSHEVLEMLSDPDIATVVEVQGANRHMFFAREICDPCESEKFGYKVNNVLVSNFVYPAWFQRFRKKGSTQFDNQRYMSEPLQLLEEGWISYFENGRWLDVAYGDKPVAYMHRARLGSRRERRRVPRNHWLLSEPLKKENDTQ